MKEKMGDRQRILHILDAILDIEEFLNNVQQTDFQKNKLLIAAVERKLEIIGEAISNISDGTKQTYPEVDWQPIKRFRNFIVHEYFGVSVVILWNVVENELPILKLQMRNILDNFNKIDN